MSKKFDSGETLHQKILKGVGILTSNVACTYGPRGRNVIIHKKDQRPMITKDGVTVAKSVDLDDPFENAAVQVVKQAAAKTNIDAGDGTTTSTILAGAIVTQSIGLMTEGTCPIEIKRGLDLGLEVVLSELHNHSRPVRSKREVQDVATISANNDAAIGTLIATAVDKVGKNGSITIEEARSVDTSLDLVEGFRFDSGYAATAFITDERKGVARYDDPLFLLTDSKLETVDQILPALEIAAREGRPFIIIADDVEGQALAALIMNSMRGSMKVAAVKAPRYGEERRAIMTDLAISIGAKYFTRQAGDKLSEVSLTDFGSAKTVEISKSTTTIVDGNGNRAEVQSRIDLLKEDVVASASMPEAERLQDRITRLASGIAIIRVGAATEIEMIEKKHRIEDALEAVKSAQQEGVVPGGAVTLLRLARSLRGSPRVQGIPSEQRLGIDALAAALEEPFAVMSRNSGYSTNSAKAQLMESEPDVGFDFRTESVVDMFEVGVIDPAKVTRCALQNAVSCAGTLITTDHAIIED